MHGQVFFGGWLVDVCGGYRGPKQRVVALRICTFLALCGCVMATPVTFSTNIYVVVTLLWSVLFCGGAVLPACSGIVVSIVPRRHRPVSSSLSLVVFNLFGYCLSLGAPCPACAWTTLIAHATRAHVHPSPNALALAHAVLSGYLMAFLGRAGVSCDPSCRLTWGFRLVLLWSYWAFAFMFLAWRASARALHDREQRKEMNRRARADSELHASTIP